jgi:hypothetical protein
MIKKTFETKITDPNGKILVSQGLKVRHKKSGYEYTVDSVVKQDGKIYILMNKPDEPRSIEMPGKPMTKIEPTKTLKRVIDRNNVKNNVIYEYDIEEDSYFYVPDDFEQADPVYKPDKLAVSIEEFESKYGVS